MARKGRPRKPAPIIGDPTDPRGMAVLRDKYLECLLVKNYSPLTVHMRRIYLNYFIRWCEDRSIVRPSDVTKPVIDRYQRWLFHYRSDGGTGGALSFESQSARLQAVKAFFKWLTRENHILSNPASEIELPRVNKRLPRHILTASEADQVINQTNTDDTLGVRDRAILETLYSTGLRRSEMVKLSIYDVHLERATVMVRQGKWHKDRLVPIGQRALVWLNKYLAEVRPMLAPVGEDTLFLTNLGEPFTPESMSQLARGYVERAKLPGKQGACHIFRHTMATLMLEGGADIRYIQAILGHSHLSTTQVYTQVGIRTLQQVHAATHPTGLLKPPGGDAEGNADKAADAASNAHGENPPEPHNHAYPPLPPSLRGDNIPADPSILGEALIGEDEEDDATADDRR